jgi:isopenicillin N synthase-like dioxygenase
MRVFGYPPLQSAKGDNVGISCGEHTDYGCLTLLNQDETRDALQVLSKSGEWVNANKVDGALVVNIGDMVNIWTNNIYKSTLHRVIHKGSNYRVSIPFFYEPNFDSVISPLPSCVAETGGSPLHKSVMYGDHLLSKVTNNFEINPKN